MHCLLQRHRWWAGPIFYLYWASSIAQVWKPDCCTIFYCVAAHFVFHLTKNQEMCGFSFRKKSLAYHQNKECDAIQPHSLIYLGHPTFLWHCHFKITCHNFTADSVIHCLVQLQVLLLIHVIIPLLIDLVIHWLVQTQVLLLIQYHHFSAFMWMC